RAPSYYVSPLGDDAAAGSLEAPFRTIDRAKRAVAAINGTATTDITVFLRGGTYELGQPLAFSASDSGMNGHFVTYRAFPGEVPVVSGGRTVVTNWTLVDAGKNLWRATVPAGLQTRQLYVNGVRAVRAHKDQNLGLVAKDSSGYSTTAGALASSRNPS